MHTPLTLAVQLGLPDIVQLLIDHGADIDLPSSHHGITPLLLSISLDGWGIFEILLDHGAEFIGKITAVRARLTRAQRKGPNRLYSQIRLVRYGYFSPDRLNDVTIDISPISRFDRNNLNGFNDTRLTALIRLNYVDILKKCLESPDLHPSEFAESLPDHPEWIPPLLLALRLRRKKIFRMLLLDGRFFACDLAVYDTLYHLNQDGQHK